MNLKTLPTQLRLKEKFTIARASYDAKDILIVSMSDGEHTGYGEACEHKYYNAEVPDMIESIQAVREIIEDYDGLSPNELWDQLLPFWEAGSPNFRNNRKLIILLALIPLKRCWRRCVLFHFLFTKSNWVPIRTWIL